MEVNINRSIMESGENVAKELVAMFAAKQILVLNLISSPGAGKTSLLERTLTDLAPQFRMAVIEGDLKTDNDARRVAATGAAVWPIETDGGCHLDSFMVRDALNHLPLDDIDILFIENVGNLVCPVQFPCGEDHKIAILSVPEGDDKPEKYPLLFNLASVMLINKTDLLPYVDFDVAKASRLATTLNPGLSIFQISCRGRTGLEAWYTWLHQARAEKL
jgi:hydrogenase nickel incorporation protein HypB